MPSYILREDGGKILREDGWGYLREESDQESMIPPSLLSDEPDRSLFQNQSVSIDVGMRFTGDPVITYTLDSGTLPAGLSLASSTGVISGNPTTVETQDIIIRATNSYGAAVTNSFEIDVVAVVVAPGFSGTIADQSWTQSTQITGIDLSEYFTGTYPLSFDIFSGSLPTGVNLDGDSGAVTGTPTDTGNFEVVFRATNSAGNAVTNTISISIDLPAALESTNTFSTDSKRIEGALSVSAGNPGRSIGPEFSE